MKRRLAELIREIASESNKKKQSGVRCKEPILYPEVETLAPQR